MTSSVYGHMTKWVRLPNQGEVRKCLNIPDFTDNGPTSTLQGMCQDDKTWVTMWRNLEQLNYENVPRLEYFVTLGPAALQILTTMVAPQHMWSDLQVVIHRSTYIIMLLIRKSSITQNTLHKKSSSAYHCVVHPQNLPLSVNNYNIHDIPSRLQTFTCEFFRQCI